MRIAPLTNLENEMSVSITSLSPDRINASRQIAAFLSGQYGSATYLSRCQLLKKTREQTVNHALRILAEHEDDTDGMLELVAKRDWDFLERVRLALLSNREIRFQRRRTFGSTTKKKI